MRVILFPALRLRPAARASSFLIFFIYFCPLPFISLFAGCLTWHCHVEPKVGERKSGMKYDSLTPEDIEPYLNGRSYEGLKVGDEIAFPEPDDTITPESLVGLRMAATCNDVVYEGTFDGFDASTGKHEFIFDNGEKQSWDIKGDEVRGTYPEPFVFEGAEAYYAGRGGCIIREFPLIII